MRVMTVGPWEPWSPTDDEERYYFLLQALDTLAGKYLADPVLAEIAKGATQYVSDQSGDPHPRILFIGEAPGEEEDRVGEPFLGRAGRFLDQKLSGVGIDRLRNYTTNLIKHRPVDSSGRNRTPTPEEIEAARPFLLREIELVDPLIVVTLGNVPLKALWPEAPGVTSIHGVTRQLPDGRIHLPAVHPSYALRSITGAEDLEWDCRALAILHRASFTGEEEVPKITSFSGEYRFLSNFYPAEVEWQLVACPTIEHAFQAAKTNAFEAQTYVMSAPTPGEAKRRGRAVSLRSDWEQIKVSVMLELVRQKFTRHPELRAKLLATGDVHLEEGNTWGDRTWGTVNGEGQNHLGKILMQVRNELRDGAR